MTRMSASKQKGFTLSELSVSLTIVAILALLSFGAIFYYLQQAKSRAAATELYRFLQFSRSYAVFHGKTLTLCASIDRERCLMARDWRYSDLLLYIDENQNLRRDEAEPIIRLLNFSRFKGNLSWRSFGNKNYLQWHTNGMTYFQNGHFLYCPENNNAKQAFVLVLNAAGRLYFTEDKNGDGIVEGSDGKNVHCP